MALDTRTSAPPRRVAGLTPPQRPRRPRWEVLGSTTITLVLVAALLWYAGPALLGPTSAGSLVTAPEQGQSDSLSSPPAAADKDAPAPVAPTLTEETASESEPLTATQGESTQGTVSTTEEEGTTSTVVSGPFLRTFAAENELSTHSRTRTQALADAKNFDLITAAPKTYTDHIDAMRQANPQLVVLAYLNGTYAQENQGSAFPSAWYARDAQGRKITSEGYGNYLMDPRSTGWIDNRVQLCKAQIARTGYSGCMLDMLGTAPVRPGYNSALPIDPSTGKAWTPTAWQKATAALAGRVDTAVTTGVVWGNGYGSGSRYFESAWGPSQLLTPGVEGALTESWIRTAKQSLTKYRSESDWKMAVDQLAHLADTGGKTAVMVKLWSSGTTAQKDANLRYALASFMLGSDGRSSFAVSYAKGEALTAHPYLKTDIGSPSGDYTRLSSGVYQRTFERGKALVNPTGTTRTVSLGGSYVTLQGKTVTSITLAPHTGDVLRKP